jgi:subtilisin family serine protease
MTSSKKRFWAFGGAILACAAAFLPMKSSYSSATRIAPGLETGQIGEARFAPDEVLIKFKPTVSTPMKAAALAAHMSRALSRIPQLDVYIVKIPEETTVEEAVSAFGRNPDIEYAEPNFIYRIALTPNDRYFEYQYALSNRGQHIGWVPGSPQGKPSADIKAPAAWEETKGKDTIVIGILDTGVDLLHPDLKNKIKNSGRDFYNDDFDATDDHGHGTMVAGIAAAETNNDEGIAGVAWNCKILPVKVMSSFGSGTEGTVSQGIIWAADSGAHVLNLSWGAQAAGQTLRDALKYAYEKNVTLIAASGNDNAAVYYPAAYDSYVLAVAATDYNDQRAFFSNFGPEIDVAAPGEKILTTYPLALTPPGFFPYTHDAWGTSMSCAHVSGLAALIKSIKPWLKPGELMDILRYSADDVNALLYKGKDDFLGYGRINMEKALVPIKITK